MFHSAPAGTTASLEFVRFGFVRSLTAFPPPRLRPSVSRSGSRYFKAVPRVRGSSIAESDSSLGYPFCIYFADRTRLVGLASPFRCLPPRHFFRSLFTNRCSLLFHSFLYLSTCCLLPQLLYSFTPFWTAMSVSKLRDAVRPSIPVARPKWLLRDEEQCVSVLPRVVSLIDN